MKYQRYSLTTLVLTASICCCFTASGLSSATPFPYFHVSESDPQYCLEVLPLRKDGYATFKSMAIEPDEAGNRKLWEIQTEYAFPLAVFLTNRGQGMVCIRLPDSMVERDQLKEWIALEFYLKGKLISRVPLSDLVDVEALNKSPFSSLAYYEILEFTNGKWGKVIHDRLENIENSRLALPSDVTVDEDFLLLRTVQGHSLYFRVSDGKLVKKAVDGEK